MGFISNGCGLRACHIAIARSIVTPLECSGWEPTCVAFDPLSNNFSLCLLSLARIIPNTIGLHISLLCMVGKVLFKVVEVSPSYFMKNSTMANIMSFSVTIGLFPSVPRLYHGVPMRCSLYCRKSLRQKISLQICPVICKAGFPISAPKRRAGAYPEEIA